MAGGLLTAQTFTFDATGRVLVQWTSPRTGKRTFAKRVYVQPFTSNVTVSVDDGQNTMPVNFGVGNPPWEMEGTVNRLLLTGTNGSTVSVSAEIAA